MGDTEYCLPRTQVTKRRLPAGRAMVGPPAGAWLQSGVPGPGAPCCCVARGCLRPGGPGRLGKVEMQTEVVAQEQMKTAGSQVASVPSLGKPARARRTRGALAGEMRLRNGRRPLRKRVGCRSMGVEVAGRRAREEWRRWQLASALAALTAPRAAEAAAAQAHMASGGSGSEGQSSKGAPRAGDSGGSSDRCVSW